MDELRDKFDDVLDLISHKNKLYNQIISNYESGNLNYQIIHNIKIILKDQISRNPISKDLATLLKIISATKKDEKQPNQPIFSDEKNRHFLHILDIENSFVDIKQNPNINSSANFNKPVNIQNPNNINNSQNNNNNNVNPEQFLSDFINNPTRKAQPPAQNLNPNANNYNNQNNYDNNQPFRKINSGQISQSFNRNNMNPNMPINPFNNNNNQINRSTTNNSLYYNTSKDTQKCEFQLNGKKIKQNIDLKDFIHSMTLIKSQNSQRIAVGMESGIVKIYNFDEKSGEISLHCDIKEHEKPLTRVVGLNNGNLLTCSQDKTLKIINFPQKTFASLFKNYSVLQILQCKPDAFYFISAIEMSDGNIIAGDWKNIIIYKPFKKEGSEGFEYKEMNQIVINNRTTALLQVDDGVFISAHYNINLVNFYDTKRQRTRTLRDIKCSDESQNCLCIISTRKNAYDDGDNSDKVVLVGGIQCMFFLSVKYQSLIYKLYLPDVSYLRTIINTGIKFYSNSIVCSGLFKQYSNDIVLFNIINQGGYNKFNLLKNFRISEADRGAINSIILLKKANANDASGIVMITGGNEKKLKVYT